MQAPKLYQPQRLREPDVLRTGTITESVGANVYVIIGEDVELVCNLSTTGLPSPKLIWTRNARILNTSEGALNLSIASADLIEFDRYCCEVQNLAGYDIRCSTVFPRESGPLIYVGHPMPSPVLPYYVTTAPTTVRVGGSLWTSSGGEGRIICEVFFANPPLESIEWFVGELPVQVNGSISDSLEVFNRITIVTDLHHRTSTLTIRPTEAGDDANITCRATSAARSSEVTSEYGGGSVLKYIVLDEAVTICTEYSSPTYAANIYVHIRTWTLIFTASHLTLPLATAFSIVDFALLVDPCWPLHCLRSLVSKYWTAVPYMPTDL